MHKDCQPSVPNRKRSQKKVPGSRTAHLEEKLDDLVSLIRSQTAVKGPNESPPVPTPGSLGQQSASDGTALPSLSSDSSPNTVNTSVPSCRVWGGKTNPSSGGGGTADSELDYYVPENEAQERLDLFRRDYPQFGPVVYIPPSVTAKELHQTRPLLWISIMACTTRSTKESHVIGDKVRHIVSERVVRQYERSLDLLQGLLVFLCWASQMLRRDHNLRWTPHMEESLRLFMDEPECEGDKILATQVRCALIAEQMNDFLIQQSLSGGSETSPYFIKALDGQLQEIWRTLPELRGTYADTVLLHMYASEVIVNELALHLPPSTAHNDVMFRLDRLQKCLKAIENWFDTYERTPASMALGGTFHLFVQMVTGLVTCIKLSKLEDFPAWDAAEVRRRLNIFALFDRIASRMETIRTAAGIQEDDEREESIWAKSAKVMGLMKAGVQADWASSGGGGGGEPPDPAAAGGAHALDNRLALTAGSDGVMGANLQMNQDALTGEYVHNFGDDPWLSAMFIPWDAMNF
ncbi:hypothetical protein SLS63_012313 [Diaporthe eres]|uniref:Uncharacterized protein n=1 Tax=Diaporthe eres TaxID=83184 RepID=A0ABR1NRQ5_DIAER